MAARLVEAAEDRARSLGARRVAAVVIDHDQDAAAFWSAMGYVEDVRVVRLAKML